MSDDFIKKFANKRSEENIKKQMNNNTTPDDDTKKVKRKSIAVSLPIYTKLKIISAKKDVQIKDLVDEALNHAFEDNIFHAK